MRFSVCRSTVQTASLGVVLLFFISSVSAAPQNLEDVSKLLKAPASQANQKQVLEFFQKRYQKEKDLTQGTHRHLLEKTSDGGGYAGWFLKADPQAEVIIYAEKRSSMADDCLGRFRLLCACGAVS